MVNTTNDEFDSPWKLILGRYFRECLEFFLPEIARDIDWSKGYDVLDKELRKITKEAVTGDRFADLLIKLWLVDGEEVWVICHVELQTQRDAEFPKRMYVYHYRAFDYFQKPVLSLAILADDNPKWRPTHYRESLWNSSLVMQFPVIKLLDYQDKLLELDKSSNPFALVVKAHLETLATKKAPEARLKAKVALTRSLYGRGWAKQDILNLYHFVDWILTLSPQDALNYHHEVEKIEEAFHVQYITTAERIGIQKGLAQGLTQGESVLLLRQLTRRFGAISTSYKKRIEQADAETLLVWGDRVLDAKTLKEVFEEQ